MFILNQTFLQTFSICFSNDHLIRLFSRQWAMPRYQIITHKLNIAQQKIDNSNLPQRAVVTGNHGVDEDQTQGHYWKGNAMTGNLMSNQNYWLFKDDRLCIDHIITVPCQVMQEGDHLFMTWHVFQHCTDTGQETWHSYLYIPSSDNRTDNRQGMNLFCRISGRSFIVSCWDFSYFYF